MSGDICMKKLVRASVAFAIGCFAFAALDATWNAKKKQLHNNSPHPWQTREATAARAREQRGWG